MNKGIRQSQLHESIHSVSTDLPTSTDDISKGYDVGSQIFNPSTKEMYICVDSTEGSAIWQKMSSGGGGGGTTYTPGNGIDIDLSDVISVDPSEIDIDDLADSNNVLDSKLENITGLIKEGSNVTITGSGTVASPYEISSEGGGGGGAGDFASITGDPYDNTPLKTALNGKEDTFNKAEDFSGKTDHIHYPTTQAVQDKLDDKASVAYVGSQLSGKQDLLDSGINIKTINGESIVGGGNIVVAPSGTPINAERTIKGFWAPDGEYKRVPPIQPFQDGPDVDIGYGGGFYSLSNNDTTLTLEKDSNAGNYSLRLIDGYGWDLNDEKPLSVYFNIDTSGVASPGNEEKVILYFTNNYDFTSNGVRKIRVTITFEEQWNNINLDVYNEATSTTLFYSSYNTNFASNPIDTTTYGFSFEKDGNALIGRLFEKNQSILFMSVSTNGGWIEPEDFTMSHIFVGVQGKEDTEFTIYDVDGFNFDLPNDSNNNAYVVSTDFTDVLKEGDIIFVNNDGNDIVQILGPAEVKTKNSIEVDTDNKVQLIGDAPWVQSGQYYGTDVNGNRGFHSFPQAGAVDFFDISGSPYGNAQLGQILTDKAEDSEVVKKSGTQTITGEKIFTTLPNITTAPATQSYHSVNKKFLDDTLNNTTDFVRSTEKGANNGVATLGNDGKIPASQMISSVLTYQGVWDADTNTPTLSDATGTQGDVYIVYEGGTQDLGSGSINFMSKDWVLHDGSIWQKSGGSDGVMSINGKQGIVTLDIVDIPNLSTTLGDKIENVTGLIEEGDNIEITGSGTTVSPYKISSLGGGGNGMKIGNEVEDADGMRLLATDDESELFELNSFVSENIFMVGTEEDDVFDAGIALAADEGGQMVGQNMMRLWVEDLVQDTEASISSFNIGEWIGIPSYSSPLLLNSALLDEYDEPEMETAMALLYNMFMIERVDEVNELSAGIRSGDFSDGGFDTMTMIFFEDEGEEELVGLGVDDVSPFVANDDGILYRLPMDAPTQNGQVLTVIDKDTGETGWA